MNTVVQQKENKKNSSTKEQSNQPIKLTAEKWKDVPGYEGAYMVSNLGHVKSFVKKTPHILKGWVSHYGYIHVCLKDSNGKRKYWGVHHLVAMAFLPNPHHYPIVNHKDENKQNNVLTNLEWCTDKYNLAYGTCVKRRTKTLKDEGHYEKVGKMNAKPIIVFRGNKVIARFKSTKDASRKLNIPQCTASWRARNNKTDRSGNTWKFDESGD